MLVGCLVGGGGLVGAGCGSGRAAGGRGLVGFWWWWGCVGREGEGDPMGCSWGPAVPWCV